MDDTELTQNLGTQVLGKDPVKAEHLPEEPEPGALEMHWGFPVSGQLTELPGKPAVREAFVKVALTVWGVSEATQLPLAALRML